MMLRLGVPTTLHHHLMMTLLPEVDSHIDIERTKGVVGGELFLLVIVRMDDRTGSHIPFGIVPYDAETTDTIEVEVLKAKVLEAKTIVFRVRLRLVVG